ncbi:phage-shock protein [Desulfotruncus alcoholivorax]|uniref:phage-shock protein n=1 Tax=Desulfotruncus alcoholivorax TaxID=265477 RepID=UPI00283A9D99|nr:phage-shock protein [Desulfotruncus alcoholivorax]
MGILSGQLNSLTDVLKKTLFFFESLSVAELTNYVHKQMLKDYAPVQVEEKVRLCLEQHDCFTNDHGPSWTLNLEGYKDNDQFYTILLKKQKPLSFADMANGNKKKKGKFVSEQVKLINDGRFIQLSNGYWGLTEWEVETSQYSLKHLVIKALIMNPTGLSLAQLSEVVGKWRANDKKEIEGVLKKFPYFEEIGKGVWCYNQEARVIYDKILKRYLMALKRQRDRWIRDRERWTERLTNLQNQLSEVESAHKEAAAALALRQNDINRFEQLNTQMAEKDLLLALRKKEIYRYKEHLQKLESKANSILYQCRLWVKRARDHELENQQLREVLNKNQSGLETMFTKLQQYKERDRENKTKLLELKELHAERVAELQTEIVNLKQKLERLNEAREHEEKIWREEINTLSTDLKHAMSEGERLNKSLRLSQQEITRIKNEYKMLEQTMAHPLVRVVAKLFCKFKKTPQQVI